MWRGKSNPPIKERNTGMSVLYIGRDGVYEFNGKKSVNLTEIMTDEEAATVTEVSRDLGTMTDAEFQQLLLEMW